MKGTRKQALKWRVRVGWEEVVHGGYTQTSIGVVYACRVGRKSAGKLNVKEVTERVWGALFCTSPAHLRIFCLTRVK